MALNPRTIYDHLRSTYWFVPSLLTGLGALLGFALTWIDRTFESPPWLGWATYGGGADGARALLSAVAGSTITVVSVTFSVMVVALTVASQHFGPRVLNSFMRDTVAQLVLGTFTGTFVYCLVVLRTVQGDGAGGTSFVPSVSVATALVITLASVGVLIYYVHHIAKSLQVAEIAAAVTAEFEASVERLYPERFGSGSQRAARSRPQVPEGSHPVRSIGSGYVQSIDHDALLDHAVAHDVTVWITRQPGDFVVERSPLAFVHPVPADLDGFDGPLAGAFEIGNDRTAYQDVGFNAQQLVEVALRALSPGTNEPFTAITCIDRLGQGLGKLASRDMPSAARLDADGRLRVIAEPASFASLLEFAFEPIAVYADRNHAVVQRLLLTLRQLALVAHRDEDRRAIGHVGEFVWRSTEDRITDARHRTRMRRALDDIRETLERTDDPARLGTLADRAP